MKEFIFDLQRFADDSTLTDDEKLTMQKSSLPHLRMISKIAKVPLFSEFVSMLERKKTETEFLSSTVAPIYNLIGALYKGTLGTKGTLKLMEEAAIFTSTVKIVDSILDICDNLVGADADAVTEKILKIADESVKIGNKLKLEEYSGIFSAVGSAALSYGLTVLASINNLTPKAETAIYKAFVKVGGATIKSVFKDVLKTGEKLIAPFGLVDLGMSALIGLIEGISQMDTREEYYKDDGLPEDIAKKEALFDALASGLKETFHSYLKGADDVVFNIGQAFGEGCKWLAHAFSGDFSYKITIREINYMEFAREVAKRGEYNSTSEADTLITSDSNTTLYAQDGDDYIENFYNNVTILAGHGSDTVSSYGGAKYNSILGGNGEDYLHIKNSSSTIEGGKDNDSFYITGDKNLIFGNDGDDAISVKGTGNIITCGAGDDLMLLDGAKNAVIEYTAGDGTDVIYGYDVSDLIKIKGSYSTQVSGEDILIQVASGGIIVKDAKDLKLNINTIEPEEEESLDNDTQGGFTPVSSGIVFMPTFRDLGNALRGSNGNDRIENTLSNVTIEGSEDNDYIFNSGNSVIAGNGNDYVLINDSGDENNISLGAGNNTVKSSSGRENVYTGDGDDQVTIAGGYISVGGGKNNISLNSGDSEIVAGTGDDTINVGDIDETEEQRYYNKIDAGDGNNYINNSNVEVSSIYAGSGNDTIITGGGEYHYGYRSTLIEAGAGNNRITVNTEMNSSEIYTGGGNDFVSIAGDGSHNGISVYSGDDSIISGVSDSTINIGEGKNLVTLNAGSSNNSIIAGSGNDSVLINDSGGSNSISLGAGNNTVKSASGWENIYTGNGNDKVTVAGGYISVGGGKNNVSLNSGESEIIAGAGDDTINVADVGEKRYYNNINAGDGNNYINNSNVEVSSIYAGSGNDTIITGVGEYYYGYRRTLIEAGAGNNKITVNSGMNTSAIYAGKGNDLVSIAGDGNHNIISVGDGRNTIFTNHYYDGNYNQYNTVEAGNGSDLIYTSGNNSFINAGSGRNFVSIAGGTSNTIVTGKGNDTIRFGNDADNNRIIFGGGKDLVINYHAGDTILSVGSLTRQTVGTDVILTDGKSKMTLQGAKGKTINTATLSSNDSVYKILVADKTAGDTLLPDGSVDTTPTALDIANKIKSTLITGTSVGDNIINSGTNVTIDALAGNDVISNSGTRVTVAGGAGNDSVDNFGKKVSVSGGAGNDDLNNYGSKVTIDASDGNDVIRNFDGEDGHGSEVSISGGKGNDAIYNYSGEYVTISGGAGNDVISNSGDYVLFNYANGDGSDKISGFNATSTLSIAGGNFTTAKSGKNIIVTVGKGKVTLTGAKSLSKINIVKADATRADINNKSAAAVTLAAAIKTADASNRTKNIQIVGNALANVIYSGTGDDKLFGNAGNDSIFGSKGDDTLSGDAGNDKLYGDAGDDLLNGGDGNDILSGGNGNDTLVGGAGNDNLTGGKGDDVFIYSAGNDVITDYAAGDKIKISAAIAKTSLKGSDAVFTIGKNTLTVTNGKNKELTFINAANKEQKIIGGALLATSGKATFESWRTIADASTATKTVQLTGNALANTILGGSNNDLLYGGKGNDYLAGNAGNDKLYGEAGNDTLRGGKGNDSLWGDKGADTFLYDSGDGYDVIYGFDDTDMLQITGTFSGTYNKSSKEVYFKVGSTKNAITLKNFTATTFNVNGDDYHISGKKLVK